MRIRFLFAATIADISLPMTPPTLVEGESLFLRKTFFKVDIQLTYFSPTHIYDFGSIPGYYECIKASEGKGNKEFREWVGDWDPKHFDSSEGVFENPRKRFLETMFD